MQVMIQAIGWKPVMSGMLILAITMVMDLCVRMILMMVPLLANLINSLSLVISSDDEYAM